MIGIITISKILLLLILALIALFEKQIDYHAPRLRKWVVVVLLVFVSIFELYSQFNEKNAQQFNSGICQLKFENGITDAQLVIGSNQFSFPTVHEWGNSALTDTIKASIENGIINLEMRVRDYKGDILAYADGNLWHMQLPGTEFNCDTKAVEIRDSKGLVVFQAIVDDTQKLPKLFIYGSLVYSPGKFICSIPEGMTLLPLSDYGSCRPKTLFKYPADVYRGVRL